MVNAMKPPTVTIDSAGRLVLPKALRDRYRLRPGSRLEIGEREDGVLLRPLTLRAPLAKEDGWWVHQGTADAPLEGAVDDHRRERIASIR